MVVAGADVYDAVRTGQRATGSPSQTTVFKNHKLVMLL